MGEGFTSLSAVRVVSYFFLEDQKGAVSTCKCGVPGSLRLGSGFLAGMRGQGFRGRSCFFLWVALGLQLGFEVLDGVAAGAFCLVVDF